MAETRTVTRLAKYGDFTSPDNKQGLAITVQVKGSIAFSDVTIPEHMAGWQSPDQAYAHKGAVATVLDTVMAFGGIHFLKRATNTKSLSIEYVNEAPVGKKLRAEARLVTKRGDGEAVLACELRDGKGSLLAQATGTYATYSVDQLRNVDARLGNYASCNPADLTQFEKVLPAI